MIDLAPSPEQTGIAAAAAAFLREQLPMSRIRELAASVHEPAIDADTWRRCAQMGWLTLSLPEADGGVGLGLPEEVMLFRELGRHPAQRCRAGLPARARTRRQIGTLTRSGQRRWSIGVAVLAAGAGRRRG